MASGGWIGKTVGKVTRGIGKVFGLGGGGQQQSAQVVQQQPAQVITATPSAAPAPTATEMAEYGVSTNTQNVKKKRGKNSLYVSSSGTGSGGTGINL